MIFKYDSIFGLEYTSSDNIIMVDLVNIPETNIEEVLKLISRTYCELGIPLFNAQIIEDKNIISNY